MPTAKVFSIDAGGYRKGKKCVPSKLNRFLGKIRKYLMSKMPN
jgi:hypothetical protein